MPGCEIHLYPCPKNRSHRYKRSFSDVSPRIVLNYTPDENINTYLIASAGYKPGGAVLNAQGNTRFEDERLWNYEAGVKMRAFDKRLAINASVFHMDWEGLQVPTLSTKFVNNEIQLAIAILNIDATSSGAELEVAMLPTDQLSLTASSLSDLTMDKR